MANMNSCDKIANVFNQYSEASKKADKSLARDILWQFLEEIANHVHAVLGIEPPVYEKLEGCFAHLRNKIKHENLMYAIINSVALIKLNPDETFGFSESIFKEMRRTLCFQVDRMEAGRERLATFIANQPASPRTEWERREARD